MNDASQSGSEFDNVYLGFWTNWAKGSVRGFTFTTSRQSGGLLIAFLAIFVGTTGRSLWRLSCFIFHRILSSPATHDALFHQRQVLLRNSDTSVQGLKNLLYMTVAWRGVARQPLRRLLALMLWAVLIALAFSTAGLFSSRVTTGTASEVLLDGSKCRMMNANLTMDSSMAILTFMNQQTTSYLAYAQRCYMGAGNPDECRQYTKPRIPFKVTPNSSCPFDDQMCKTKSIIVDTGFINSNLDLGINLSEDSQFNLRIINQCVPVHSKNYTSLHNQTDLPGIPLVRYHFGNYNFSKTEVLDYVYQAPANLSMTSFDGWRPSRMAKADYNVGIISVRGGTNESGDASNQFTLIPELHRSDADVSLFFLTGAGIHYSPQVNDPWYSAHTSSYVATSIFQDIDVDGIWIQDEPASVLGCISQSQICNPSAPNGSKCLPLAGFDDNLLKLPSLWKNPSNDTANFLNMVQEAFSIYHTHLDQVLYFAGNIALSARLGLGVISRLPDDQWEKEVLLWSSTSMAGLQDMFARIALGLENFKMEYTTEPGNDAVRRVCQNQRITSTQFTSFSVLGIAITLLIGGVIIVLDCTLEFCMDLAQRKAPQPDYDHLEWKANATLQLHRLAHEAVGSGIWSKTTGIVPITGPGEVLTSLNIADRNNPKLAGSETTDTETKREAVAEEESTHDEVNSSHDEANNTHEADSTHGESDIGVSSGRRQEGSDLHD